MTDRTVRFIRNVRTVLSDLSVEELYQLALALRDDLARRGLDCGPEAKALTCALLAHARDEHRARLAAEPEFAHAGIEAVLAEFSRFESR